MRIVTLLLVLSACCGECPATKPLGPAAPDSQAPTGGPGVHPSAPTAPRTDCTVESGVRQTIDTCRWESEMIKSRISWSSLAECVQTFCPFGPHGQDYYACETACTDLGVPLSIRTNSLQ